MGDRPGRGPQAPAAAAEEGRLGGVAALHHLGVELFGGLHRRRAAVGLAGVDPRHGHARFREALVHPLLCLIGIGRERRAIKDPGTRGAGREGVDLSRREQKRRVAINVKNLAGNDEVFRGRRCRGGSRGLLSPRAIGRRDNARHERGCGNEHQRGGVREAGEGSNAWRWSGIHAGILNRARGSCPDSAPHRRARRCEADDMGQSSQPFDH